jgi:hypothetical protein
MKTFIQILTPKAFLRLVRSGNKNAIKRTKFIAPKLGSNNLGKICVQYNYAPTTRKKKNY